MRTLCFLILLFCTIEGSWTPRNRFWKPIQESQSGLVVQDEARDKEQRDVFDSIQSCMNHVMPSDAVVREVSSNSKPRVVDKVKNSLTNETLLVEIDSAISPQQAQAVKKLSECARQFLPSSHFEHRDFSTGGNDVTFLSVLLPIFLPSVAATVQQTAELAYETANWNKQQMTLQSRDSNNNDSPLLPPPGECGLRTTEFLSYQGFKHLGEHGDAGSVYTVLFALSDPKTFQGGEYYLHIHNDKQDEYFYLKPRQYSAIVFLSDEYHGVTDIQGSAGTREMFANELWVHDDPPFPHLRPQKEYMELFLKWVEEDEEEDFDPLDPESFWPSDDEVEEYLKEIGKKGMKDGSYQGHQWYTGYETDEEEEDDGEELDWAKDDHDDYDEDEEAISIQ